MPENLYRRKGVYYARVKINGRDYRPSLRTRSKAEARRKLRKILGEIDHVRSTGEERHSWKKAVAEWVVAMAPALKVDVLERYKISLRLVGPILEPLYVDEISTKTIAKVIRERRAAGVTNASINRDLTAISSVLTYCCAQAWRDDNPAKAYDRRVTKEKRDPIVLPEPADILAAAREANDNFGRMILAAWQTGMRQEEIASLERKQVREQVIDLTRTKTSRARSVPLSDLAWGTIKGTPADISAPWVFWHRVGDEAHRYRNVASNFAQLMRRLVKEKKISRRFAFHHLRHRFAVDYLRDGGNIYQLQQILGHSSIRTTEIYLDFLTPEEKDRAKYGAQKGHNTTGSHT